jgi:ABC-type multidrug transport system fused ATPase/permease subunit
MSSPRFLWEMRHYFRLVWARLLLGSVGGILMNTAVVLPAILLGRALDKVLALERGQATANDVAWAVVAFVGGTFATEVPRIFKRWFLQTANSRIRAGIRADAFRGVLSWPTERLHRTPVGDIMGRIVSDVEVVGVGIREFTTETWDTVLFSASIVVTMFIYDAGLTVLALLPVPFAMLLAKVSGRWVSGRTTATRQANASLTTSIQEQLAGIRVLRLFGRSDAAAQRVAGLSEAQAEANIDLARLRGGLQPVYSTLMTAGVLLVVWQGGERVVSGALSVGAFVAYLQLFTRFVTRGYRVPQLVNSVQSGAAAWLRVRPLTAGDMNTVTPRARAVGAGREAPQRTGAAAVSIQHVTFRYPDATAPALVDVSLDIPAGSLVAITGPVGAGKTSLARALLGVYPLESGSILVDGRSVDEIKPDERAALVGFLPQHAQLFSGSVAENVFFGREARDAGSEAALNRAIEISALAEDLCDFPAGLDTPIGELGIRISGGQRLRVALARAMGAAAPGTPGLLVLDDPFSAVDVDTEAQIVEGLLAAFGPSASPEQQATIVLLSHRLAAFPRADLVVVLRDGAIEEQGAHAELMAAAGLYAHIYSAQRAADAPVGTGARP